jgi:hypothetical protein
MNYAAEVARVRARRDRQLAAARRQLEQLRQVRDLEIRRLHAQGVTAQRIGVEVGCSDSTVVDVLNPAKRAEANSRRLLYWRERRAGRRLKVV